MLIIIPYSTLKASVVERFNCTLKNMWKIFTLNDNYKWVELLRLVSDYNASIVPSACGRRNTIAGKLLGIVYSAIKILQNSK